MVFILEYFQIKGFYHWCDLIDNLSKISHQQLNFESIKIPIMQVLLKLLKKLKIRDWRISMIFIGLILH